MNPQNPLPNIEQAIMAVATALEGYLGTEWVDVTFQNSWVNYDATPFSTHAAAQYRRDKNGNVYLRGLIKSGTVGSAAFTLPEGFRTPARQIFVVLSNAAVGRVHIDSNGEVVPSTPGNNAWYSLDGIVFQAEQA